MKRLFYYLRIYRRLTSQYLKDRLSFQTDFILGSLGMMLSTASGFLSLLVIFRTITSLAGWDLYEMLFLYGFFGLAFAPVGIFFDKFWSLWGHLNRGDFIHCYFKPLNTMFYYVSDVIDIKAIGHFTVNLFVTIYAAVNLSVAWTAIRMLCLVPLYLGAAFTFLGIRIIVSSTAFWLTYNISLMDFTLGLERFARYPLTIFARPFQVVFVYILPYAFIAYVPVNHFLKSPGPSVSWFITPLVGAGVFALGCLVWTLGVRRYTGTGT
ncbi:MAG: ABC-2 family transporter protein [Spirochaetales bacterium]|nr:ABC-2 family transporter protein [Spirochaetales bacterium]